MKLKPILLYILFFITAFVVFLFLLFPQREVSTAFSRLLTHPNSKVQVTIEKVKPGLGFPFKLSFENTKLLMNQTTEIVPESFEVFFGPAVLFNTKKILKFQSNLYQGSLKGSLRLNRIDPLLFSQAKLFMSGVKISDLRYKTDLADITLGCEVSGEYEQIEALNKKGAGQGTILIKGFSAKLKDSLFNALNLPLVDFSDIKLEFTQSPQSITVTQCIAKGSIINIKFKGNIDIISPLQKSSLNFTGTILPDSPYLAKFANTASIKSVVKNISKDGIRFNIKGTLENPKIGI